MIELVGSSPESWEKAAATAVETAGKRRKELRIGEVTQTDSQIADGKVIADRAKLQVFFKHHLEIHE